MPLQPTSLCSFLSFTDNYGTNPSTTPGTSITTSASANTKGAYTQVLSALAQDAYGILIRLSDMFSSSTDLQGLVDIGVDLAGGTSYTVWIPDLIANNAPGTISAGFTYYFPIKIPAGATVGARAQSNFGSQTVRVAVSVDHTPTAPESWLLGSVVERIGTITTSRGVAFTPGNAADGTWVSLGTTTRPASWVQLGFSLASSAPGTENTYVDLAVGDSTTKRVLQRAMLRSQSGPILHHMIDPNPVWSKSYHRLFSGAELWIRGRCSGAPSSTYHGVAYVLG